MNKTKATYFESIGMMERLHRLFLEVMKMELDRLHIEDITSLQAIVLYNIGKRQLTIGELKSRGCYLGTNVNYNLQKMKDNNYIISVDGNRDKRSTYIKLSAKGLELFQTLQFIFITQENSLHKEVADLEAMNSFCQTLHKLETFWSALLMR